MTDDIFIQRLQQEAGLNHLSARPSQHQDGHFHFKYRFNIFSDYLEPETILDMVYISIYTIHLMKPPKRFHYTFSVDIGIAVITTEITPLLI